MKLTRFLVFPSFLLLLLASAANAEFRAGIALRVVTPDPLLPVSGGVGPSNPVTKKEGDLTVRALVLADDKTKVAIVSADFLGFPSVLGNKVRAKVKGKIAFNYYAEQLYDPRCNVIQVLGADARPFVTLVNYAVHPEVLGPDAGILSPDLVGPLYDRIRENGGGTGIFMNSAQGGMVTADNRGPGGKSIRTWPECVRIGALLADEALRIVKSAPVRKNPQLFCAA